MDDNQEKLKAYLKKGRIELSVQSFVEDWAKDGGFEFIKQLLSVLDEHGYLKEFGQHFTFEYLLFVEKKHKEASGNK
tara:strand:- start:1482 stop:1712 length:231 start_codon:yes stop_codon:yes gene_type:complete